MISNKRMVLVVGIEFEAIKHNVNSVFESTLSVEKREESYHLTVMLERATKEKGRQDKYDYFYLSEEEWRLIGELRGWIK